MKRTPFAVEDVTRTETMNVVLWDVFPAEVLRAPGPEALTRMILSGTGYELKVPRWRPNAG